MSTTEPAPQGAPSSTTTSPAGGEPPPQQTQAEPPAADPAEDTTDWKAEARKWEQRAKDSGKQVKSLSEAQRASMSEAERAIAEAEERGRTAAGAQYRDRLVTTEFAAAVARRNPEAKPDDYLDLLDLSKLADEHGEPDDKAIQAAAERLVPEPQDPVGRPPSFDAGVRRQAAKGTSFSDQLRADWARR